MYLDCSYTQGLSPLRAGLPGFTIQLDLLKSSTLLYHITRTEPEPSVSETGHLGDLFSFVATAKSVQHPNHHSFALDGLEDVNLM